MLAVELGGFSGVPGWRLARPSDEAAVIRAVLQSLIDLYQVSAYALSDRSDAYRITQDRLYSGRYGAFASWSPVEAMHTLANAPVDLAEERSRVWALLGG